MAISAEEASVLRQAGARDLPTSRHVIESWLWDVVNPQIDHCEDELKLLEKTLTFRQHDRNFERLRPLREALVRGGRDVFDDIRGEIREYDRVVDTHDEALGAVLQVARRVFDQLIVDPGFAKLVAESLGRLKKARTRGLPESKEHIIKWRRQLAAHVVNGIDVQIDREVSDFAPVWNECSDALKAAVPGQEADALMRERNKFVAAAAETLFGLRALRKEWSRLLNIPVAPDVGIEASSD